MKSPKYNIAFLGSSLLSAYWNGAATYYRGIIKALHRLGHHTTFFEPDAFDRQEHRDISEPYYADVEVYKPTKEEVNQVLQQTKEYDIVVKASGVGVFDAYLEEEVLNNRQPDQRVIFWDVDAPATLASMDQDPEDHLQELVPEYDLILTYGGGQPVVDAYEQRGARRCVPIFNALDPDTHHPVVMDTDFYCDLAFLGNRLPDREERMDEFFFSVASSRPDNDFLLGGNGWDSKEMSDNIRYLGHVYTKDHNAFNVSPQAVLNINRDSMAEMGFSPATRVFEAAGAGACLITDYWEGIELFLEPGEEVLVAHDGDDIHELLDQLTPRKTSEIGQAAFDRMLSEHTYQHRGQKVVEALKETFETKNTVNA